MGQDLDESQGGAENVKRNQVEISSQNHGFTVLPETLGKLVVTTHENLNDGTLEGLIVPELKAFSVQYHPEASPGPQDAEYLFTEFTELMIREKRSDA